MQPMTQQRVENRLGERGDSVFNVGTNATIDTLHGLCAERFKIPVNGTTGLYTADGRLLRGTSRLKAVVRPDETVYLQQKQRGDDCLFGCDWLYWSLVYFLVAIAGIIITSCVFALNKHRHPFDLGVVIDAGSSHSEALVFKWIHPKTNGTGQAVEIGSVRGKKGGISSLTVQETYDEYQFMLNQAKDIIAKDRGDATPVLYMSATGGMRLLRMQNPDRSDAIMGAVREAMKDSGLKYKSAVISDGADEGAQGWVSINHIEDRLSTYQPTLGALDLGGASTQITVEVENKNDSTRTLKLYGKEYHLFSKSYLCFGLDQAYLRYVMTLLLNDRVFPLNQTNNEYVVDSPCHCNDFSIEKNLSSILGPCVWNNEAPRDIEEGNDKTIVLRGKWNATQCQKVTTQVFDVGECRRREYLDCFDDLGTSLPMNIEYVAFSGFFFTASEVGLEASDGLEKLELAAKTFCELPYTQWLSKYYKNDSSHAEAGCFKINLVRKMLIDKYNFTNDGFKAMQITQKIDGQGISWPMGLMLNATNALPEEHVVDTEMSLEVFLSLLTVYVIMIFISFVLFHYYRKADLRKVQGLMFASSIRTS